MPLIALLTDFGLADHYVGTMKGVMLGICPGAALVDITHEVAPQDVLGGALQLDACWQFFPRDTVFLAVVDPGVGSSRRAIAAEIDGRRFVAPDNGLLTLVVKKGGSHTSLQRSVAAPLLHEIANPRYAAPLVSRTFEGRDRFAPAAAWLAAGVALADLGPEIEHCVLLDVPAPHVHGDCLEGEVLMVDRFGNLITNIGRAALDQFAGGRPVTAQVGGTDIGRTVETYAEIPSGTARPLVGSSERLEVSVNRGSAAAELRAARGTRVALRRAEPF